MRANRAATLLITGTLALAITACGQSEPGPTPPAGVDLDAADASAGNGLWLRSGQQVTTIVADAVRSAGPVHVSGSITETVQDTPESEPRAGRTLKIEFRGTATAYAATLVAGDVRLEAVVTGDRSRVRGNAAFARDHPGYAADAVVCTTGTDAVLSEWDPLLDPASLVTVLLSGAGVSADPPEDGDETLDVVTGEEGAVVGVLTVERSGPPLPRRYTAGDASGDGELTFEAWGEPVDLEEASAKLPCPTG